MTESFQKRLTEGASELGLSLSTRQQLQLFRYYELLVETNRSLNLTAITEEAEVVTKHFIDSMALAKLDVSRETSGDSLFDGKKLIDVGTGAGFPGVVLKIIYPELRVCLSDSLQKRLRFLEQLIQELGLREIITKHGRAEDLGHAKEMREQFDFAVSRAVAKLSVLSEYDLPFVRRGGAFIAMKSTGLSEERKDAENAIRILGGEVEKELHYLLPDSEIERSILLVRKTQHTKKEYPRKAGTPSRKPL